MRSFFLDAYNIIHAVPQLEKELDRSLLAAREALLEVCQSVLARNRDIRRMVVVFDGSSDVSPLSLHSSPGIEIVFTDSGEEADDRILKMLGRDKTKKRCVVSNDNFVGNSARAYGADTLSALDFFRMKLDMNPPRSKEDDAKSLAPEIAKDVTDEYKRFLGID